jgi:hypothetical protein
MIFNRLKTFTDITFCWLIFLLISFFLSSFAQTKTLTGDQLTEILIEDTARLEMQRFASLSDRAMDAVEYQNNLQFEINDILLNEFLTDSINKTAFIKKLKLVQAKINNKHNEFIAAFSKIKTTSSSKLSFFNPFYEQNYKLISKISDHERNLANSTDKQIIILIDEDIEEYDQQTAQSYIFTADFFLLMAESMEINAQIYPDQNLSKILVDLDIYGMKVLSDVTRLQAFYLMSESINPEIVVKINKGILAKVKEYLSRNKEIKIELKLLIETFRSLVESIPQMTEGNRYVDNLDIYSINYIKAHNNLIDSYVEIADLYLLYKDDLDSIPQYRLDAVNALIERDKEIQINLSHKLNAELIEFQNYFAEIAQNLKR